jgi:hypothetical protein
LIEHVLATLGQILAKFGLFRGIDERFFDQDAGVPGAIG